MTRNNSRNSRNNRYNNRPSYMGLWLFTIILFVTFTVGLVYLGKHKSNASKIEKEQSHSTITKTKNEEETPKTKTDEQNQLKQNQLKQNQQEQSFEFYDILTQSKIDNKTNKSTAKTPNNNSTDSTNNSTAAENTATTNTKASTTEAGNTSTTKAKQKITNYVLEILRTKDFEVVDHVKAELALIGYEINITKTNNSSLYVVTVGPYNNKSTALTNQKQLLKYNVKSIVKPVK